MLSKYPKPLVLNDIELDYKKETFVMGILNVTPDSFSDGGSLIPLSEQYSMPKKWLKMVLK